MRASGIEAAFGTKERRNKILVETKKRGSEPFHFAPQTYFATF